ncbi:MAG: ATP-binding cassette domain-containing protein [Myxococcota bacterium]
MNRGTPLLEAQDLFVFRGATRIVEGFSVSIRRGEVVGLAGTNGSGKTTLFEAIAGERPSKGILRWEGRRIDRLPAYRRAGLGLSLLPQTPSVFRGLTVQENLLLALQISRVADVDYQSAVLLRELQLEAVARKKAGAISVGERRRLEIARSLALKPRLLLMDEPFAGLDALGCERLEESIAVRVDTGLAVMVTDHDRARLRRLAHRVVDLSETGIG